ncbi:FxSxx-COOH system tetratricopeptide repeat protein [Streptomyces sp. NPDC058195]|uniref:FxSxx-COOH system tetratricopeptide repeat protein n=1 Tax=Streptomyces sp. NPDC058195 TaxID=3346375 RepID=UPI0036E76674
MTGSGAEAGGPGSIAASGDIGVAVTGDGARLVTLPAEAVEWVRRVDAPPGAGNLPGSASGVFVGRGDELARLNALLTSSGEAAVTQTAGVGAVHGLGGIGKSTLALHYAHTHRHAYTVVWWLNASTSEQIVAGLADLAMRLCPQWAAGADVPERAAWAILWLQWHPGWLLVFDNVEDPRDLRHYLGALPGGHHLATSRTGTGWHTIAPTMPLGLLGGEAATDLLCTLALGPVHTPRQRDEAASLAAALGHLPLALEQAGAYLFETGTPFAAYRSMLGEVMDTATAGVDPERTIARIWHHTLAVVERRNPKAITLLEAMAWLAPDAIPRSLLAPLCPNVRELGEALGTLHAYNMITFSADRRSAGVHRLVQTVLRHQQLAATAPDALPSGRRNAEHLLHEALPEETAPNEEFEHLLPHAVALAETTPPSPPTPAKTVNAWLAVARYLGRQERNAHAVPLRVAILAQRERVLGDTAPDTLVSRNNLANAYRSAGDHTRAIPLFESVLAQRERVLGETNPHTLVSRNNLANAYDSAGDLDRAIPLYEATLAQRERVLGDTHLDTLVSRNNLACAYDSAGEHARAIELHEATLAQRVRALGDTHPSTLISRNGLACAYDSSGDLDRAIPLYEATLAQRVQVLGDTHPSTLISRNNLAYAYRSAGEHARAIALHKVTLAQRERVLGDTHPDTLISRNNLACSYRAAGDLDRAIPLFEIVVAQSERILGADHPGTRGRRGNLASALRAAEAARTGGDESRNPGSGTR